MSFRQRQKYKIIPSTNVGSVKEVVDSETGEVHEVYEDMIKSELPKPELFDLGTQLKAGIDQDEVKSQILAADKVDINKVIRKYTKKEKKNEE